MQVTIDATLDELRDLFEKRPLPFNASSTVRTLMQSGHKIEAIKLHRNVYGSGLKVAKEMCEALEANPYLDFAPDGQSVTTRV